MEKISIVKLRKKNMSATSERSPSVTSDRVAVNGNRVMDLSSYTARKYFNSKDPAYEVSSRENERIEKQEIEMALTVQQSRFLKSNRHMQQLLEERHGCVSQMEGHEGTPIIIKFEFEKIGPVRMLKSDEVAKMLRISTGFLYTLVRNKRLKSYKVGRLRRFMLDDVIEYIENNERT